MKKKFYQFLLLLFISPILATGILSISAYAEDTSIEQLTFVAPRPQNEVGTQRLIRVYTEVFKRLGITFKFLDVPSKRASIYSDSGEVDGELSRVYDYNISHPNLVRVEEPNKITKFVAFATDSTISLNGWDSLKNTQYRVECQRGIMMCVENVSKMVPPGRFSEVQTIHQAIQKLLTGRTDIYIDDEVGMLLYLESKEYLSLNEKKTVFPVGIMAETSGHMWLHKKRAILAPKIAEVLREMKREGVFQKLYEGHTQ